MEVVEIIGPESQKLETHLCGAPRPFVDTPLPT